MKIPWNEIPAPTLDAMLEEIVTRDGTDYGVTEKTTLQKVTFARNQLKSGLAILFWDAESESATLLSPSQVESLLIQAESEAGSEGENKIN